MQPAPTLTLRCVVRRVVHGHVSLSPFFDLREATSGPNIAGWLCDRSGTAHIGTTGVGAVPEAANGPSTRVPLFASAFQSCRRRTPSAAALLSRIRVSFHTIPSCPPSFFPCLSIPVASNIKSLLCRNYTTVQQHLTPLYNISSLRHSTAVAAANLHIPPVWFCARNPPRTLSIPRERSTSSIFGILEPPPRILPV